MSNFKRYNRRPKSTLVYKNYDTLGISVLFIMKEISVGYKCVNFVEVNISHKLLYSCLKLNNGKVFPSVYTTVLEGRFIKRKGEVRCCSCSSLTNTNTIN